VGSGAMRALSGRGLAVGEVVMDRRRCVRGTQEVCIPGGGGGGGGGGGEGVRGRIGGGG